MLVFNGCHKLWDRKMYYETTPDTFVQAMFDSMPPISVFFKISIFVTAKNLEIRQILEAPSCDL